MRFNTILLSVACLFSTASFADEPVWDANKVELVNERLAPGVYAFYPKDAPDLNTAGKATATSGGLIVGTRGTLMIDTMVNHRLNAQALKLAAAATPLPLTWAVNTSSHGDHSYGNMYLPATTRIIQHVNTRTYVDAHLADDKAFMIENFGAGRGIEEIQARTGDLLVPPGGKLTIDLGGKTVDIIDFGFAQTGGDLFVWQPDAKVLFTGNAITGPKPALPWLLDGHLVDTLDTLRKVYEFLPADARVVPGHGVPVSRDVFTWYIGYLMEVRRQVQLAIDKGLTLEQTVAEVTMPEYHGYALFDWLHPKLNVPAAYKDLEAAKR